MEFQIFIFQMITLFSTPILPIVNHLVNNFSENVDVSDSKFECVVFKLFNFLC